MSTPEQQIDNIVDAGLKYRAKLIQRAKDRTMRIIKRILIGGLVILIMATVLAGVTAKNVWDKRTRGLSTDQQSCSVDNGKKVFTATRYYTYPYVEFLNFRWIDKSQITEYTELDLRGYGITVIGTTKEGRTWTNTVTDGEQGVLRIADSENYTFMYSGGPVITSYKDFCKIKSRELE